MLDEAEYASDTDESDEDYKPDADGDDVPSEIESDGDPENDGDNDTATKNRPKKRTATKTTPIAPTKRSRQTEEVETSKTTEKDELIDDEDDNEDALWASFLSNSGQTATKPDSNAKQKPNQPNKPSISMSNGSSSKVETVKSTTPTINVEKKKLVTEIFEFAGEKVEIQKEVTENDDKPASSNNSGPIQSKSSKTPTTIPPFNRARSGGGLSSVLGQLGKKNKLSVLEKSKLDWTGFKRTEGIDEELQTHNKGRDGYLERQDFLQRTDLRQFEREKNMRHANRRK